MIYTGSKRLLEVSHTPNRLKTFVRYDGVDFILTTEGIYGQTNSIKLTLGMLREINKFTNLLDKKLGE